MLETCIREGWLSWRFGRLVVGFFEWPIVFWYRLGDVVCRFVAKKIDESRR